jgi:hypothetical protein
MGRGEARTSPRAAAPLPRAYALHHLQAQAQGKRVEERGGTTAGRKFLGFSFTDGPDVKRIIAPKALEQFKRRAREITRRAKGVSIETTMKELASYAGLGRLFQLLRNTRSAHRPQSLGPAATPGRSVAAVEDTTSSPRGADRTGGERSAGEQYRRQRSWSLASCQEQGPLSRSQQQVLQIARTSISIWHVLAQLLEPPYTRPVRTVVWEGRRREASPYPDSM